MQIWFFIKWIGFLLKMCGQFLIGWFILGRSCSRCKYSKFVESYYDYSSDYYACTLDSCKESECCDSITRTQFKRS